jgi:dipeptidyl aminopeptidase/acylaminoacyl peptidase
MRILLALAALTGGLQLALGQAREITSVLRTEASVEAPDGARIRVYVSRPGVPGEFPALVMVPGGLGAAMRRVRDPSRSPDAWAKRGYVAVSFDPQGRGRSEGEEDYNGFAHQDGLAAVIRYAAALPAVAEGQIGVMTFSYGVTMGTGALARHPELPVKFLFDCEGPSSARFICYRSMDGGLIPIWRSFVPPEEHEAFWDERQAVLFVPRLKCRYFRFQKARDHVHGPNKAHAIELLNAAGEAGVWTRCNDNPPRTIYDPDRQEQYDWDRDDEKVLVYIDELMAMPAIATDR